MHIIIVKKHTHRKRIGRTQGCMSITGTVTAMDTAEKRNRITMEVDIMDSI